MLPLLATTPTDTSLLSFGEKLIVSLIIGTPALLASVNYCVNIWRNMQPQPTVAETYATKQELRKLEQEQQEQEQRIEKLEQRVSIELRDLRNHFDAGLNRVADKQDQIMRVISDMREALGEHEGKLAQAKPPR